MEAKVSGGLWWLQKVSGGAFVGPDGKAGQEIRRRKNLEPTCEVQVNDNVVIGRFLNRLEWTTNQVVTIPLMNPAALHVRNRDGSEEPFELCIRTGSLGLDAPAQILNRYTSREQAFTDLDAFYVALSHRQSMPRRAGGGRLVKWGLGLVIFLVVTVGIMAVWPVSAPQQVASTPAVPRQAQQAAPVAPPAAAAPEIWSNMPSGTPVDADTVLAPAPNH